MVGKGRPTPKRREAEGRRGPATAPPRTQREAAARAKASGRTMTKDERRVASSERRERMMRGDDSALLPRDRGPVRAYARDVVDTRRNLAGLLMPIAILSFLILMFDAKIPALQVYGPAVLLLGFVASILDSVVLARRLSRGIAVKFPKGDPNKLSSKTGSLAFYAFNRGIMPRRWRIPRPRVARGAQID